MSTDISKSYQCKRKVCKNADNPSISTKMAKVREAQIANVIYNAIPPWKPWTIRPLLNTIVHNTSDNSIIKMN